MKIFNRFSLLVLALLYSVVLAFSVSHAAQPADPAVSPQAPCAELIKECFATTDLQRSNCLFSAYKHPFCEGEGLASLIYKRWIMSPVRPVGLEDAPSFLGPRLIDQECLAKFDSKLLTSLMELNLDEAALKKLDQDLLSCTKEISNQLTRP